MSAELKHGASLEFSPSLPQQREEKRAIPEPITATAPAGSIDRFSRAHFFFETVSRQPNKQKKECVLYSFQPMVSTGRDRYPSIRQRKNAAVKCQKGIHAESMRRENIPCLRPPSDRLIYKWRPEAVVRHLAICVTINCPSGIIAESSEQNRLGHSTVDATRRPVAT